MDQQNLASFDHSTTIKSDFDSCESVEKHRLISDFDVFLNVNQSNMAVTE